MMIIEKFDKDNNVTYDQDEIVARGNFFKSFIAGRIDDLDGFYAKDEVLFTKVKKIVSLICDSEFRHDLHIDTNDYREKLLIDYMKDYDHGFRKYSSLEFDITKFLEYDITENLFDINHYNKFPLSCYTFLFIELVKA